MRVDTPEKNRGSECEEERKAAFQASKFAKSLLRRKQMVFLTNVRKGKYAGRIIAEVILPNGRDFGTEMLKAKHAIPYEGGKKFKIWCGGHKL